MRFSMVVIAIEDPPCWYRPRPSSITYPSLNFKIGSSINIIMIKDPLGWYWSGPFSIAITLIEDAILTQGERHVIQVGHARYWPYPSLTFDINYDHPQTQLHQLRMLFWHRVRGMQLRMVMIDINLGDPQWTCWLRILFGQRVRVMWLRMVNVDINMDHPQLWGYVIKGNNHKQWFR